MAILDNHGIILETNQRWNDVARASGGSDVIGHSYLAVCDAAQGEDQAVGHAVAQGIRDVMAGVVPLFEIEYPCHTPEGPQYFRIRVSAVIQGEEKLTMAVHEDVTRRRLAEIEVMALNRTLEARVEERTRELEASRAALAELNRRLQHSQRALEEKNVALEDSNRELAQFAFVASHDLQEPLRTIGVYADVLRHRYQGTLDARADSYLQHITEQVGRARNLVRDVLALARVSVTPAVTSMDLAPVWCDVAATMSWPADAQWHHGALPPIRANENQMRQLLTNLLSNAIKYRAPAPLTVALHASRDGDAVHFTLADNGIGLLPEHHERVFIMFQRLHGRTETGGNGIGLAVCKKIIDRHGGKIWLDTNGSGGTTVHFTVPHA